MDHTIVRRAEALLEFRDNIMDVYPELSTAPMDASATITIRTPVVTTENGTSGGRIVTFEITNDAMVSFVNWIVQVYRESGTLLDQAGVTGYPIYGG